MVLDHRKHREKLAFAEERGEVEEDAKHFFKDFGLFVLV